MADIDRRAVLLECALDDLDCTHDPRTKSAGLRKIHFHGTPVTQVAPNSFLRLHVGISIRLRHLQYRHRPCRIVHMGISNIRTTHYRVPHPSLSPKTGGTLWLCVKKRSSRKGGSPSDQPSAQAGTGNIIQHFAKRTPEPPTSSSTYRLS